MSKWHCNPIPNCWNSSARKTNRTRIVWWANSVLIFVASPGAKLADNRAQPSTFFNQDFHNVDLCNSTNNGSLVSFSEFGAQFCTSSAQLFQRISTVQVFALHTVTRRKPLYCRVFCA